MRSTSSTSIAPTVQSNVLEIAVAAGYGQPGNGDEVKIAMMVFAPNHSQTGAASVATSDPAWADAKSRADAAVATLRADPSKFDAMARDTTSNETPISTSTGGELPWIPADLFNAQTAGGQTGLALPGVQLAVFAPNLTPNTILDPIQETSQGYVVVKFEGRRPGPSQRIADAQLSIAAGADFAAVARQVSEATGAPDGGDLGWVAAVHARPGSGERHLVDARRRRQPDGHEQRLLDIQGHRQADAPARRRHCRQAQEGRRSRPGLPSFQSNTNVWTDQAALTALTPASPTP